MEGEGIDGVCTLGCADGGAGIGNPAGFGGLGIGKLGCPEPDWELGDGMPDDGDCVGLGNDLV